jgi:NAD(P)-dependent dehydrogenase (short-subunit alcohol dehydrogenase family)
MSGSRGSGRSVIVTGAGSGIGRATALAFAALGDHVMAADLDAAAASETVTRIQAAGGRAIAFGVDVSDPSRIAAMVEAARDTAGRVDVLVNNAGYGIAGDVVETNIEELDRTLAVNVRGVFLGCQAAIPVMLETGGGVIVNVTSAVAFAAVERRAAYTASKGAVLALTRSIAIDFMRRGIRCNCVAPGTVDSPWVARITDDQPEPEAARQSMIERQPLGRLGTLEEIASSIVYLASPEASFIHGACLTVDGGFTAR